MKYYIVQTTCRARIRETWRICGPDAGLTRHEAGDVLWHGSGEFLHEEVLGEEEDRTVESVEEDV